MRGSHRLIASGFTALTLILASLAPGHAANPKLKADLSADDQKTIDSFLHATKAYLAIQHAAPSHAQLKPTTDIGELDRRRGALKQAIRAARPNARQGDLFTPAVAALFRKLMGKVIDGPDGNKVRRSLQDAEPVAAAEASQIAVNQDYPNQEGQPLQSTPATLLQHLPVLPKGLEYRLVGRMLVLRDTKANIVVDYLPNALK